MYKCDAITSWLNNYNDTSDWTSTAANINYNNTYTFSQLDRLEDSMPEWTCTHDDQTSDHEFQRENWIIKLIKACFNCVSKLINKIDELMIVIEFDFEKELFEKYDSDIISLSQIIDAILEKLLSFYNRQKEFKNKVKCIMRSNCKQMRQALIDKENVSNYYFRLIFQSTNYNRDGGDNGPLNRLYCCPHCDKDNF